MPTREQVGAVPAGIVVDRVDPPLVALEGEVRRGRAEPPDLHAPAEERKGKEKKRKIIKEENQFSARGDGDDARAGEGGAHTKYMGGGIAMSRLFCLGVWIYYYCNPISNTVFKTTGGETLSCVCISLLNTGTFARPKNKKTGRQGHVGTARRRRCDAHRSREALAKVLESLRLNFTIIT